MKATLMGALAGLFALSGSETTDKADAPHVGPRLPVLIHLEAPNWPQKPQAKLIQIARKTLELRSILTLGTLEEHGIPPASMKACAGKDGLLCWILAARPDYNDNLRQDAAGFVRPYARHLESLRRTKVPYARYLLVLSVHAAGRNNVPISAVLINTDRALKIFHLADREAHRWRDQAESDVFRNATYTTSIRASLDSQQAITAFFDRFWASVSPQFKSSGHHNPHGNLEIETNKEGLLIEVDGRPLGRTLSGTTPILRLKEGPHHLQLKDPTQKHPVSTHTFEIIRGNTLPIKPVILRTRHSATEIARQTTLWGGVALATAGATLTLYTLLRPQHRVYFKTCSRNPCDGPAGGFINTTELGKLDAFGPSDPSGIAAAPLGYSLAIAGATLSLGTLLQDDSEIPWIPLCLGITAGFLSYGLSTAID